MNLTNEKLKLRSFYCYCY